MNGSGDWSTLQAIACIQTAFENAGRRHLVRHITPYATTWRNEIDRTLAWCEDHGVNPSHYFECFADTMGWYCDTHKQKLHPRMLCSRNAADRYNKWVARKKKQFQSFEAGFSREDDLRLKAEMAFVEVFGALFFSGRKKRIPLSLQAATSVDADYHYCSRRRVIALCDYLHRIHRDLPDVIMIPERWKMSSVFTVVARLIDA